MMRILFVTEISSIHAARWINQLNDTDWAIHVFQAIPPVNRTNSELNTGYLYCPYPLNSKYYFIKDLFRLLNNHVNDAYYHFPDHVNNWYFKKLSSLIKKLQPDIIHSLGFNINWRNYCLPVLQAKKKLKENFPSAWIYSSWGSDLDYYARCSATQKDEVTAVLSSCDFYISECKRDYHLAKEYGFSGKFLGYFPAFGGIDTDLIDSRMSNENPSQRRIILLKGRDNSENGDPVGRAMIAMNAFEMCEDALSDYSIRIFQATSAVKKKTDELQRKTNLDVSVLPYLSYDTLLDVFGQSRLFISLTVNDGIPSSLVESMSLGAFPIHSNLDSIAEWITNGKNGILVPAEGTEEVANAIERAITDDVLVDTAAKKNRDLVQDNFVDSVVKPRVLEMYGNVFDLIN